MAELTLSEIRKRAEKRLARIEEKEQLEKLVEVWLVGVEETEGGKVLYAVTIKSIGESFHFKGIGYTPEAAVANSLEDGVLIFLRIESRAIRAKVKELIG